MALMSKAILKYFPEGTKTTHPNGGFSLWVELPKFVDSIKLFLAARNHNISFIPGSLFSVMNKYRNFIHLNTAIWSEKAEKAISVLGNLAAEQKM